MARSLANVRAVQNTALEFYLLNFLEDRNGRVIDAQLIAEFEAHARAFKDTELAKQLEDELRRLT